jgi:Flp pilus assembly CpaF family ATPase
MEQRILRHLEEINRCNQRGGRMLSIRDLLDAGTLNEEMAAYLLAVISTGNSFLVGARPGGVGKTTVMAALLNFIPASTY